MVIMIRDLGINKWTNSIRINLTIEKSHVGAQGETIEDEEGVITQGKENSRNDEALIIKKIK